MLEGLAGQVADDDVRRILAEHREGNLREEEDALDEPPKLTDNYDFDTVPRE